MNLVDLLAEKGCKLDESVVWPNMTPLYASGTWRKVSLLCLDCSDADGEKTEHCFEYIREVEMQALSQKQANC